MLYTEERVRTEYEVPNFYFINIELYHFIKYLIFYNFNMLIKYKNVPFIYIFLKKLCYIRYSLIFNIKFLLYNRLHVFTFSLLTSTFNIYCMNLSKVIFIESYKIASNNKIIIIIHFNFRK